MHSRVSFQPSHGTAAQLPTHETECTVVESEWGERNYWLTGTGRKKGIKYSPETLHRNWYYCINGGGGSQAASSGANIRPVTVLRTASASKHSSTRQGGNIVITKQGLKSQMDDVDGNCALLGYYAASSGNFLPTFRDSLSVPSSGATRGPIGCPETSVRNSSQSA